MKNLIQLFVVFAVFTGAISCKDSNASAATDTATVQEKGTIKVLAPQAMHEVLKESPTAQLVDVRTDQEYKVSHLRDAQNICVTDSDFKEKVQGLDKNKPVYVYCKSGGRSGRAAKILQDMGFKEIYDLDGGITKWNNESLETEQ